VGLGVGILALLSTLGMTLAIIWPREFRFRMDAVVVMEDHVGKPIDDLYEFLATTLVGHHAGNAKILDGLQRAFRFGCVALAVETIALVLAAR
jgi:hypothetical protein